MIVDLLSNFEMYTSLNPLFSKVAEFLHNNDLASMPDGKYKIAGDDLYVNITTAKSKDPATATIEGHRRMLDIQIPLDADETYGYTPVCLLPEADYNDEKDRLLWKDIMAENLVTCHPGMFAIFFPQDGHAPCIATVPEVKKAIFKVKV